MTSPLVASNDADLAFWQNSDQETFLNMACAAVTDFCGWHIAPSITVTNLRCWFGGGGVILLPSKYVTAVSSVTVDGNALVADTDYFWDSPQSYLRRCLNFWPHDKWADVTFTHGYTDCPLPVKEIIFQLMSTAMELPASNADEVMTMEYRLNLKPNTGVSLSEDQKRRLSKYRIFRFGAPAYQNG